MYNIRQIGITIYALIDPTNQTEFYIGQTVSPSMRLANHKTDTSINQKTYRIMKLNGNIEMKHLQVCLSQEEANACEEDWIDYYLQQGIPLTNTLHRGKRINAPLTREQRQEMTSRFKEKKDNKRVSDWWVGVADEDKLREAVGNDEAKFAILCHFLRQCSVTPRYANYAEIEAELGMPAQTVNRILKELKPLGVSVKPKPIEWGGSSMTLALVSINRASFISAMGNGATEQEESSRLYLLDGA